MSHRFAHVAVVGRPNVGKSSLVNALVGYKVSIVSPKPQTTRHRILGIATQADAQLVFVDTPGMHQAKRAMNRYMNRAARSGLEQADVVVMVIQSGRWTDEDEQVWNAVSEVQAPRVLVINKIDLAERKETLLPFIEKVTRSRDFARVLLVSAIKRKGLEELQRSLIELAPEGEAQYEADDVTDKSERFLIAELIREQVMWQLSDELPFATTVTLEQYEQDGDLLRLGAVIWVERAGQKAIVIGKGGAQVKSIGERARLGIERQFGTRVFLELWVRERASWSDDERSLGELGYRD